MSNDTKYEYNVAFFQDYSGSNVADLAQRNIVYMAEKGWEFIQINPSVVAVTDAGNGMLVAQHCVTITYRRPIQQDG